MAAGDLQRGDRVRRADGTYGTVQALALEARPQVMYNLTVATAHTFFVGQGKWLVHNVCPADVEARYMQEAAAGGDCYACTMRGVGAPPGIGSARMIEELEDAGLRRTTAPQPGDAALFASPPNEDGFVPVFHAALYAGEDMYLSHNVTVTEISEIAEVPGYYSLSHIYQFDDNLKGLGIIYYTRR